jgi:hypothetical protein
MTERDVEARERARKEALQWWRDDILDLCATLHGPPAETQWWRPLDQDE